MLSSGLRFRWVAALLVAQLALLSPECLRILAPSRSACREDCAMHAKRLRCHASAAAEPSARSHCPHARPSGAAFHAAGCTCGTSDSDLASHREPTLVGLHDPVTIVPYTSVAVAREELAPEQPALEPPLRPPAVSVAV